MQSSIPHPTPERVGKYQVIRKLGEGATSDVFLCHDEFAGRDVAVKVVYRDRLGAIGTEKVYRKLFVTEASLAGRLAHPHIVQIYDAVVADEAGYIVMEYVAGGTLEQHCQPNDLLPFDRTVEIVFKCTRALDYANTLGVTHRDIKPANLLLAGPVPLMGGVDIKISDFGSAIMATGDTTQVSGIGSPAYMSPQQIKEHPLNFQTDIYSLGVVMYQMLTGALPFQGKNNFTVMYQITSAEPPPPSAHRKEIPPSLDRIVKHAMEKELDRRYASWEEFSLDLATAFRTDLQHTAPRIEVADTEKFNTLRTVPFFREFSEAELWEVLRISRWQDEPAGRTIIREGEPGDFFCIIATGEVAVFKRNKLLNVLGSGECVGEMAYLKREGNMRSADVSTLSPARVITLRCEDLDRASDACRHRFDRTFMSILVERLSYANTRLSAV